jgi:hypothetical protein
MTRADALLSSDEEWWSDKLMRLAKRSFGDVSGRHARKIFGALCGQKGPMRFSDAEAMRNFLGVPNKYLSRALALVIRTGVVRLETSSDTRLILARDRLPNHKMKSWSGRGRISRLERDRLVHADRYLCGHCGKEWSADELEIDHIIPICLLGADQPGNWVPISSKSKE